MYIKKIIFPVLSTLFFMGCNSTSKISKNDDLVLQTTVGQTQAKQTNIESESSPFVETENKDTEEKKKTKKCSHGHHHHHHD